MAKLPQAASAGAGSTAATEGVEATSASWAPDPHTTAALTAEGRCPSYGQRPVSYTHLTLPTIYSV